MEYPFVTVIVPSYNEEKYIKKCLEGWVNQNYPKDRYEILVYDGMSTDKTGEIVRSFEKNYPGLIYYKLNPLNPKLRQVSAFNMGIQEARGDFIVIYGAHTYPDKDFLKKSIETFFEIKKIEPKLVGVGGKIIKLYENKLAKFVALIYSSPLSGASSFWYEDRKHFAKTIAYALYNKDIFMKVGMFDEDLIIGEDFEFNLRINKKGYKLFYNPEIKSYYFTRSTWKSFLKQTFNYGVAKAIILRKGYFSPLWLFPLGFLSFEVLLITMPSLLWVFLGYWFVLFIESIRLIYKSKDIDSFALPFIMFLFHNIVSLGFISGLVFGKKSFWC